MEDWQRACETLRQKVGDGNYEAWIKPLRVAGVREGAVYISVPNKFYRDWVSRHYLELLRSSLCKPDAPPPKIVFQVDAQAQGELFAATPRGDDPPKRTKQAAARVGNLIPRYTFDNFVVGTSNQFAHAAAKSVAGRPGEHYNPLFVYGWVGVGKTHLVNAIGHAVLAKNPLSKIVYLSSESFVNDLISSIRRDRMDDFKNRFRRVDLLILDDVQFLAGRERTQEEFFHTFNSLYESHRQIVLTSDKFPNDIQDLEERLRNRFEWGLIADIQAPEMETRIAIVQKKAEIEGLPISAEVAGFIASEITSNVRELEGALTRLGAFASLHKAEVSVDFARNVLKPHLRERARQLSIEDVQRVVCEHFGLSLTELKSKRRTQNLAIPRQIAMYLSRKLLSASFPVIGGKFGGRDHSTVIHAQTVITQRQNADPSLRATIERLERALTSQR
jgi:chromosomal replication initiator protein